MPNLVSIVLAVNLNELNTSPVWLVPNAIGNASSPANKFTCAVATLVSGFVIVMLSPGCGNNSTFPGKNLIRGFDPATSNNCANTPVAPLGLNAIVAPAIGVPDK